MSSSDIALSVRGLTKEYQILHNAERHDRVTDAVAGSVKGLFRKKEVEAFRALDDVSFDVKKGEVLGVIGRNGAGKSTLLKILSRITEPTSGEVHLFGRVGSLLEVGTGFHPELTGRENIFLNGAILGMKKREIERQFDAIVDFAEVEKFLDTPVKRYSSGMYVRLAFAVAAHLNPEILIVDEVLAVGDAQFQKKCLGKMQDVSRQDGRTVLFVSHNMAAVRQLCSRAIVLNSGKIQFDSTASNAIERHEYQHNAVIGKEYGPNEFGARQLERDAVISFRAFWFEGEPRFAPGEQLVFCTKLLAIQNIPVFRIALSVFSCDGLPVGTVFGPSALSIKGNVETTYEVKIQDTRLAPGNYWLNISVGSGDFKEGFRDHDIVQEVLHFEVSDGVGEGGTSTTWHSSWGHIMLPSIAYGNCDLEFDSALPESRRAGITR